MRIQHIHIGHHFFGAGNIGDDLMVAGFLQAINLAGVQFRLTCCTPHNILSQRHRFPEIEWLDYTTDNREQCVRECDIWLGLGDSPFQTDVGMWLVRHLVQELQLCHMLKKPMYYLGVGANNADAFENQYVLALINYASHIWTRDEQTAAYISSALGTANVSAGTDLANIYLARHKFPQVEPGTIAFLMHFEKEDLFDSDALCEIIDATNTYKHRWLHQEVRPLQGSESNTFKQLQTSYQDKLDVRVPDYQNGTTDSLIACWDTPEILITSRYHGTLTGAASGSRVIAIRRNDKIKGIARQLNLVELESFCSSIEVLGAINNSKPLHFDTITSLGNIAQSNCNSLFRIVKEHY